MNQNVLLAIAARGTRRRNLVRDTRANDRTQASIEGSPPGGLRPIQSSSLTQLCPRRAAQCLLPMFGIASQDSLHRRLTAQAASAGLIIS